MEQYVVTKQQPANQELLVKCFGDRSIWEMLTFPEEKKEIYRALVSGVVVRDGQVERVELKV